MLIVVWICMGSATTSLFLINLTLMRIARRLERP